MKVDKYKAEQLLAFYETMFKMRRFEEETFEFYKKGMMAGLAHLYLGEEAVATGVCAALKDEDYIASTHRGHGHLVARGADINRMMARKQAIHTEKADLCTSWPWTKVSSALTVS